MSRAAEVPVRDDADGLLIPGLAFAGIAAFYTFLGIHQGVPGLVADDAIYLLMADLYSPYFSNIAESAKFVGEHIRFPPLYPALLAVLGAGSKHLIWAHAITVACLLATFAVCFFWFRRAFENNGLAVILVVLLAVLPTSQIHALNLWSEHLYLLLSVSALALSGHRMFPGLLAVAVLVGAASLTRTLGVALMTAFVLSIWLAPTPRRIWLTIAATVPFAAWALINAFDSADDANVSFLFSKYADGDVKFWQPIINNAQAIWNGWRTSFDDVNSIFGAWVAAVCAGTWIGGWAIRIRHFHLDAIYVFIYLGIIMIWPNDDHARRFLFPLIPVALFQSFVFVSRLSGFSMRIAQRRLAVVFAALLMLVTVPSNAAITARLLAPMNPEIAKLKRTRLWLTHVNASTAAHNLRMLSLAIESYRIAVKFVPANACVFSVHPEMFMYHARRSSYAPPVPAVPDAEFTKQLRRCRYVHLLWMTTHPYLAPGYPGERLPRGTVLYSTQWKVGDRITTYSELIELRGEDTSGGEVGVDSATALARRMAWPSDSNERQLRLAED